MRIKEGEEPRGANGNSFNVEESWPAFHITRQSFDLYVISFFLLCNYFILTQEGFISTVTRESGFSLQKSVLKHENILAAS